RRSPSGPRPPGRAARRRDRRTAVARGGARATRLFPEARQAEPPESPAGEAAELRLHQAARRAERLVDRGEDHVLEDLGIAWIDRFGVDLDLFDLAGAVCGHGDHAAARRRLDGLLRELALCLLHLLLHLA